MLSPREVTQTFLKRWADDPAGAMASMVARDIIYTLNVSPDFLLLGGETIGWDAVNAKMMGIRELFDYLVYKPRIMGVAGDQVRANIEVIFRHKFSGELLMGHMRTVVMVRDDMIARVDEYVDAPLIESFMRLFSAGQDAGQP
jgi:ketosteroid isomerase-like protein